LCIQHKYKQQINPKNKKNVYLFIGIVTPSAFLFFCSPMDLHAAEELRRFIDRGVTAGEGGIPPACLTAIKGLVRAEPVHAPAVALETLLLHLRATHAQERLGALAIADVLFQRSHAFRLGIVRHMDAVLVYATGHSPDQPLPKPAKYARKLRREFCEMLGRWHKAFGSKHKSLAIAFGFVQSKLQQDVEWQRANNDAGSSRSTDDLERVMQFRRQERLAKARQALGLFQERRALMEEQLAHARRELRCLISFPGGDGHAGCANSTPAGAAGGASQGLGAALGASSGGGQSVFGSIFAVGSSNERAPWAHTASHMSSPCASRHESASGDREECEEEELEEDEEEEQQTESMRPGSGSAQRGVCHGAPQMEHGQNSQKSVPASIVHSSRTLQATRQGLYKLLD
jgi:hypothetical protein